MTLGIGVSERVTLVRLDPAEVRFCVLYTPGEGRRVSEWASSPATAGPTPLLVVNGGYFTPEYLAIGLLVSNERVYGRLWGDVRCPPQRAGRGALAGGPPYNPGEVLVEAVQSFPVLVRPGGVLGFPPDADEGQTARRTVVALDRSGRILFLAAQDGFFSLHTLARWLLESDLEVDTALNLDGGQSTGLYLQADGTNVCIDSGVPVPAVIVAEERSPEMR